MAVYKRSYTSYKGDLTSSWFRWLVPARYALETLFQSRLVVGYLVACYIYPLIAGTMIYLRYNASAIEIMGLNRDRLLPIDASFFATFLSVQGFFSFLLTAYAAPGLIGPDLSNNALPLYLCRPISKAEYVLSKIAVLLIPLSLITWLPGTILWLLEAGLEGGGWGSKNLNLLAGTVVGSVIWIVPLALLGLALSAWVRWKILASALLFGVFFVSAALSAIVNRVLDTRLGYLLNPSHLTGVLWANILNVGTNRTILGILFDIRQGNDVPQWAAWMTLTAMCLVCVRLLNQRLRGREVVS